MPFSKQAHLKKLAPEGELLQNICLRVFKTTNNHPQKILTTNHYFANH